MKYVLSFVAVAVIVVALVFCVSPKEDKNNEEDFMRIHVVANSDSTADQNVKYEVKDAVVQFLQPKLSQAQTKQQAVAIILESRNEIQNVAQTVLRENGMNYCANVQVCQENAPTRAYDKLVLEGGLYDCLNITLGQGLGDNWWCVVFPAVCFLSPKNSENVEYISKIWDTINNVM